MSVETGISGCTGQVFAISEWDVLSIRGLVTFGESEINNVNRVFCMVVAAHQEVIGLDIPMDDSFFVHSLDSLDHLHSNVKASLQIKFSSALLELVLKTLSEEVHNHDVVHLAIFRLLIADKVQVRHCGLSS